MAPEVITGAESQARMGFPALRGSRLGLVANHTSRCSRGHLADVLAESETTHLVALFAPEHGFWGRQNAEFPSRPHPHLGLPVHSLYGAAVKPTPEMLAEAQALVFDVQGIGIRYYTYETTMRYCLEATAAARIPFVVFDRPNPLGGDIIEGPVLDQGRESFVGALAVPVRHGLTMGELALFTRDWLGLDAEVRVVRMEGWRRAMDHGDTGLPWVPPSPAMLTLTTARVYGGTCLCEGTNLSEGRGTPTPFEIVGAPFVPGPAAAAALEAANLPGVAWQPAEFRPERSKWAGRQCQGVRLSVKDPKAFRALTAGIQLLSVTRRLAPAEFTWNADHFDNLIGNTWVREWIERGSAAEEIVAAWRPGLEEFAELRRRYLLY